MWNDCLILYYLPSVITEQFGYRWCEIDAWKKFFYALLAWVELRIAWNLDCRIAWIAGLLGRSSERMGDMTKRTSRPVLIYSLRRFHTIVSFSSTHSYRAFSIFLLLLSYQSFPPSVSLYISVPFIKYPIAMQLFSFSPLKGIQQSTFTISICKKKQ